MRAQKIPKSACALVMSSPKSSCRCYPHHTPETCADTEMSPVLSELPADIFRDRIAESLNTTDLAKLLGVENNPVWHQVFHHQQRRLIRDRLARHLPADMQIELRQVYSVSSWNMCDCCAHGWNLPYDLSSEANGMCVCRCSDCGDLQRECQYKCTQDTRVLDYGYRIVQYT